MAPDQIYYFHAEVDVNMIFLEVLIFWITLEFNDVLRSAIFKDGADQNFFSSKSYESLWYSVS